MFHLDQSKYSTSTTFSGLLNATTRFLSSQSVLSAKLILFASRSAAAFIRRSAPDIEDYCPPLTDELRGHFRLPMASKTYKGIRMPIWMTKLVKPPAGGRIVKVRIGGETYVIDDFMNPKPKKVLTDA